MPVRLSLNALDKRFGSVAAVSGVSLGVEEGEFVSLLGPSGCGKTTLLRLVAGFLLPDAGTIFSREREITHLPPHRRNFGVVFQNYALFPHMTVLENVGYGLKVRGRPRGEIAAAARAALDRVGLSHAEDRFPNQLSGGQQQRVALARAIVIEPELLLLDEPLSALDKNLREEMQVELRLLQRRIGIATVFVTHDQEEAMTLSDRIAVMQGGRMLQLGPPREVYDHPANEFVATFLGTTNMVQGRLEELHDGIAQIRVGEVAVRARAGGTLTAAGQAVKVAVRPECLRLSAEGPGLRGTVKEMLFQGHRVIALFDTDDGVEMRAFVASDETMLRPGEPAVASWAPERASVFPV